MFHNLGCLGRLDEWLFRWCSSHIQNLNFVQDGLVEKLSWCWGGDIGMFCSNSFYGQRCGMILRGQLFSSFFRRNWNDNSLIQGIFQRLFHVGWWVGRNVFTALHMPVGEILVALATKEPHHDECEATTLQMLFISLPYLIIISMIHLIDSMVR